jgi:hypothetical protein
VIWCVNALFYLVSGTPGPLLIATAAAVLLSFAVAMAWSRYARKVLSVRDLATALVYALWKIPLYAKFLVSRQMDWVRSKRNGDDK